MPSIVTCIVGPAATCGAATARPALKSSRVLRGVRGALLSAIVLFGLIAPFRDVAHAHDPASNPTGHKETPVEVVPGADQPSITSIIPALGDFK